MNGFPLWESPKPLVNESPQNKAEPIAIVGLGKSLLVGGGCVNIHRSFLRSRDSFVCVYSRSSRRLYLMESSHIIHLQFP